MLSECSLRLAVLWWNRRAEGAGSSWEEVWTTTLLKSAGGVCVHGNDMGSCRQLRYTYVQMYVHIHDTCCAHTHNLYTYTHARTSLHGLPRTLKIESRCKL